MTLFRYHMIEKSNPSVVGKSGYDFGNGLEEISAFFIITRRYSKILPFCCIVRSPQEEGVELRNNDKKNSALC